ncbi:MAG: zinc ribbon domain-containing protein [Desulfatiglandaceae bacterium]
MADPVISCPECGAENSPTRFTCENCGLAFSREPVLENTGSLDEPIELTEPLDTDAKIYKLLEKISYQVSDRNFTVTDIQMPVLPLAELAYKLGLAMLPMFILLVGLGTAAAWFLVRFLDATMRFMSGS